MKNQIIIMLMILAAFSNQKAYADDIVVIIRTFIPDQHPSKANWTKPIPGLSGEWMLPDLGIGECFGTDNRSFSNEQNASARFGGKVVVSTKAVDPFSFNEIRGVTKEYNCNTGAIVCEKIAGTNGFSISNRTNNSGVYSFTYEGAASNPCLTLAPKIKFNGSVVIDTNIKEIKITAKNDVFPAFEAIVISGGKKSELFRINPDSESTPLDLLISSASREITRTLKY